MKYVRERRIKTTRKDGIVDWMGKSIGQRETNARNGPGLSHMGSDVGIKRSNQKGRILWHFRNRCPLIFYETTLRRIRFVTKAIDTASPENTSQAKNLSHKCMQSWPIQLLCLRIVYSDRFVTFLSGCRIQYYVNHFCSTCFCHDNMGRDICNYFQS